MNVLTPPRPPVVDDALALARIWCAGHTIDGGPALRHACAVAVTLGACYPDASPELIAAALLHDAPEYAGTRLEEVVAGRLGHRVLDLIRALEASHQAMDRYSRAPVAAARTLRTLPPEILAAGAADKIVALRALLIRAERAPDRTGFWHHRHAFVRHVPYFRTFATAVAAALPGRLADELDALVTAAERQTR